MISCFKGKFRLTSPSGDRVLNGVKGTAYKSLDISAFTGIPNKVGIYEYKEDSGVKQNKYSYDDTVDAMIRDGVTDVKNMQNWEKMLDGREKLEAKYVREIFRRYHEKMNKK